MSRPRSADSVFRAIADPTRRRILEHLEKGDRTVGDLMGTLNLRKNAATFHLGTLMSAGLVRQNRLGRNLMCTSDVRALTIAQAWLARHGPAMPRPPQRTS